MEQLKWYQKIIYWLVELSFRYNCEKGRHKWGYTLSESGVVYLDDEKVPKELWHCLDCEIKKYTPNKEL
jgi:hypothetical protein